MTTGLQPDPRRTRAKLIDAVRREVELMETEGLAGPASLLQVRLARRGVAVTLATLRSGDCRPVLERVWKRRPTSTRRYGPTGGHDLRPVEHLVEDVIDITARIARVEADLRGEPISSNPRESRRPAAPGKRQDERVAARAALISVVVRDLAARGVDPTFATVAQELGRRELPHSGDPAAISDRQLRRLDEYSRPILEFQGREKPLKPPAADRKALMRLEAEELGAMVHRLLRQLRELEARFMAMLD